MNEESPSAEKLVGFLFVDKNSEQCYLKYGFANREKSRNFLAHDYQKNTIPELEKFLKYGLNDLKKFIRAVEALL